MISRALENTLVDRGGQLLPPYVVQLVPDFSYSHQSLDQLAFFTNGNIVRQQSHRDQLEWGLGFRIGLPWETQFNLRVPLDLSYASATFGGNRTINSNRGGLGDISMAFQKQVLHEKGWVPDLLVNVAYTANTGSTSLAQQAVSTFPFAVGTGSGFNQLGAGVIALKRQDPLVFLGGFQLHAQLSLHDQRDLDDSWRSVLHPGRGDPCRQPRHIAASRLADDVPAAEHLRRYQPGWLWSDDFKSRDRPRQCDHAEDFPGCGIAGRPDPRHTRLHSVAHGALPLLASVRLPRFKRAAGNCAQADRQAYRENH